MSEKSKLIMKFESAGVEFQPNHITIPSPINFDLFLGEIIFFVGPNGSGKTTLMNIVYGTIKPTIGEVKHYIDFVKHSTRVYQHDALLLKSNIYVNLKITGAEKDSIISAAKEFNLGQHLEKTCELLSGGEKRLVQFLRVLLSMRAIWLLDEPTSGVDDHGVLKIGDQLLRHTLNGGCVLCVTHDKRLVDTIFTNSTHDKLIQVIQI